MACESVQYGLVLTSMPMPIHVCACTCTCSGVDASLLQPYELDTAALSAKPCSIQLVLLPYGEFKQSKGAYRRSVAHSTTNPHVQVCSVCPASGTRSGTAPWLAGRMSLPVVTWQLRSRWAGCAVCAGMTRCRCGWRDVMCCRWSGGLDDAKGLQEWILQTVSQRHAVWSSLDVGQMQLAGCVVHSASTCSTRMHTNPASAKYCLV